MAEATPADFEDDERFLTFAIDDQRYALPANDVAEIVRLPALARVPQAPPSLLGLGNLRGQIVPVASVRGLLGKTVEDSVIGECALILSGDSPVALAIGEPPTLTSAHMQNDSGVMAREGEALLGAFSLDDQTARVLDIKSLIAARFVARTKDRGAARHSGPAPGGATALAQTSNLREQKIVTFRVAGQEFALEIDAVREIIPSPDSVTSVPHTDRVTLGVTSYRESLLPLMSLRGLLGLAEGEKERSKVIVSRIGNVLVGLVADQAEAILTIDDSRTDPPPAVLTARSGGESKIKAIYRGEGGRRLVSILATEQLFREDVMQRVKAAGADVAKNNAGGAESATSQFVVFKLADNEFCLPIEDVIEVTRVPERIARVPKAPAFLEGVVSLRGELLPVLDQRRRFDLPVLDKDQTRRMIVVNTAGRRAGLIVDSVTEVLGWFTEAIEPAPELVGQHARLVTGVVNIEDAGRMVMVLDASELLNRAEQGLLEAFRPEASAVG